MFTEQNYLSDWLKGELESPKDFCREAITVLAGEELRTGAVLGTITATGKYVAYDPDATDGSQTAVGILITRSVPGDTSVDEEAVALVRGPAVIIEAGLTWLASVEAGDKTTALAALAVLGIRTRESA